MGVDVITKTSTTAVTNQTYTGNLYQYSGDMDPWFSKLIGMLWINFVIECLVLCVLLAWRPLRIAGYLIRSRVVAISFSRVLAFATCNHIQHHKKSLILPCERNA